MQVARYFCFLFIFVFVTNLTAADKEKIAVVEFKNKSEAGLRFSGSDLASWMSNELKKKDRFEPVDRKALSKIVKDAEWVDERLSEEAESKLRDMPARYVLYGSLVNWNSSISPVSGADHTTRPRADSTSGVVVVFYFELVDLETGKSVKTLQTDGDALTLDRPNPTIGSAANDLRLFDQLYEEASKTAMRRAAIKLSEE
jgi:curli biogenesis system outer membrane secretion channel CsgG